MLNAVEIQKLKSFCERITAHTVSADGDVESIEGFCRIYAGKSRTRRGKAVVSGLSFVTDDDAAPLVEKLRAEIDQIDGPGKVWVEAMVAGHAQEGPFATLTLINEASETEEDAGQWDLSAQEHSSRAHVEMARMAFAFAERAQDARFALPEVVTDMAHRIGVYEGSDAAIAASNGQAQLAQVLSELGTALAPAAMIFAQSYAAERAQKTAPQAAPNSPDVDASEPVESTVDPVSAVENAAGDCVSAAMSGELSPEQVSRLRGLVGQLDGLKELLGDDDS